MQADA